MGCNSSGSTLVLSVRSPRTLVAADPAATAHTLSAIVLPDGRGQMTWPPGLTVARRHDLYEHDGTLNYETYEKKRTGHVAGKEIIDSNRK